MKVLKFKGKMSLKNKVLIATSIVILIASISVVIVYLCNEDARNWININILKKEVTEDDVATIEINSDQVQYFFAYDKYITKLSNGKLEIYNSYATKAHELEIGISNPIFAASGSDLLIAENGRTERKFYIRAEKKNGKLK